MRPTRDVQILERKLCRILSSSRIAQADDRDAIEQFGEKIASEDK
jgi:hypothetical protein